MRCSAFPRSGCTRARRGAYLLPALGPISKHLVTKAARHSTSIPELYKKLAEQIPQQNKEREAFLKIRRCRSRIHTFPGFEARSSPGDRVGMERFSKRLSSNWRLHIVSSDCGHRCGKGGQTSA